MIEPSLFDEAPWHLVPHAVFLSWDVPTQLAYSAARDRDSATSAVGCGEDPSFYIERASAYERMRDAGD